MTMCFKHNKFFRIGRCPECVKDEERAYILDLEIRELEREIRQPIVLWERQ